MKTSLPTLVLLISLGISSNLSAQQWAHFFTDDFYTEIAVTENKVWAGTRCGLFEYNRQTGAYQLHTLMDNPGLPSHIRHVLPGIGDNIWIEVQQNSSTLFYFDGENVGLVDEFFDVFQSIGLPLLSDSEGRLWVQAFITNASTPIIISIAPDGSFEIEIDPGTFPVENSFVKAQLSEDGTLYLGSYFSDIVVITDSDTLVFDSTNTPILDEQFDNFFLSSEDHLWVTQDTDDSLTTIIQYFDETWTSYNLQDYVNNNASIQKVAEGADNKIYFFLSDRNVLVFDDENWTVSTFPDAPNESFPYFHPLGVDPEDNWWYYDYSNASNRLIKYDQDTQTTFNTANADFLSNSMNNLHIDLAGNLWAERSFSVERYTNNSWENLSETLYNYSSSFHVHDMAFDPQNQIFISISDNFDESSAWLLKWNLNFNAWTPVSLPPNMVPYHIEHIEFDPEGNLWITTGYEHIYRKDGPEWTHFDPEDHPVLDNLSTIGHINITSNGDLWLSGYNGVVKFDGQEFTQFDPANLEGANSHWTFLDNQNLFWVRGSNYLIRYEGLVPTFFDDSILPLPLNNLLYMTQDIAGDYWFSFVGAICKFDGDNWTVYDLPIPNSPRNLLFDTKENLWVRMGVTGLLLFSELKITPNPVSPSCIEGTVFFDADEDGTQNSQEITLFGNSLILHPENTYSFVSILDTYHFDIFENGEYEVECLFDAQEWEPSTPAIQPVSITEEGCVEEINFGLKSIIEKYEGDIFINTSFPRCNQIGPLWVDWVNTGTSIINGQLVIELDPLLTVIDISISPSDENGNMYTFNIDDLYPYQSDQILFTVQYPSVDNLGETVTMSAELKTWINSNLVSLDQTSVSQEILCSFDPNDKTAYSTGPQYEELVLIGDTLEYLIRFENMGNDTAFRVVIKDTLDINLNLSTFEVLASSHPVITQLFSNRLVEFRFEDILLPYTDIDPIHSQGFVRYRIVPIDGLPPETVIENNADIYFDFNPPIHTNTTHSILVNEFPTSVKEIIGDSPDACEFLIYPNPAKAGDFIQLQEATDKVQLFDNSGRKILEIQETNLQQLYLPNNLISGTYFLIFGSQRLCWAKLVL